MILLFGIANCDTVRRARSHLDERGIDFRFHDFRKSGLPADRLDDWISRLGWEALVNRRGTSWRQLSDAERAAIVDVASARAALIARPTLIKRPVVEWEDGRLSVGFDPDSPDWKPRQAHL